jgi:hypothetical protein
LLGEITPERCAEEIASEVADILARLPEEGVAATDVELTAP